MRNEDDVGGRHSISAMFSLDSLTPKNHDLESISVSLAIVQPKL